MDSGTKGTVPEYGSVVEASVPLRCTSAATRRKAILSEGGARSEHFGSTADQPGKAWRVTAATTPEPAKRKPPTRADNLQAREKKW